MDRLRKAAARTAVLTPLFLVLASTSRSATGQSQDEATNISCFFCHMGIVAEMKARAVDHWEAKTKCEACHGTSMKHLDVEDNSINPDRVWNSTTVHGLCGECHGHALSSYLSSTHAKVAMKATQGAAKAPSCSSCHGYHGLKSEVEIRKECLRCHPTLPTVCSSGPGAPKERAFACKECHDSHSLLPVKRN